MSNNPQENGTSPFEVHTFPDSLNGLNVFYELPPAYQETVLNALRIARERRILVTADDHYFAQRGDTPKQQIEGRRLEAFPYSFANAVIGSLNLPDGGRDNPDSDRTSFRLRMILVELIRGINFEHYKQLDDALDILATYLTYPVEFRQNESDTRTATRNAFEERWAKLGQRTEPASEETVTRTYISPLIGSTRPHLRDESWDRLKFIDRQNLKKISASKKSLSGGIFDQLNPESEPISEEERLRAIGFFYLVRKNAE